MPYRTCRLTGEVIETPREDSGWFAEALAYQALTPAERERKYRKPAYAVAYDARVAADLASPVIL